jgi:hypothetical protein
MLEKVIAVSNVGSSEQIDVDILQCKVDILRECNIIPLHDNTTQKNPVTQNSTRETTQSSDAAEISTYEDTSSIPIETIPAKETTPLPRSVVSVNKKEEAETSEETPDSPRCDGVAAGIPSFDLAEEIMAEQRKITAIRRKAPGQKTEAQRSEPQAQPADYTIEQPTPALSEQEKIIAEIVARDIERLCRGDYSANGR